MTEGRWVEPLGFEEANRCCEVSLGILQASTARERA